MWYLKVRYKHNDCLFTDKICELGLSLFHYYLGSYEKEGYVYVTAFQKLEGDEKQIKKYVSHLRDARQVMKLEVYEHSVFVLAMHKKERRAYHSLYDPKFVYPAPAIVDKEGFEVVEVAFWEKSPLQELISEVKKDKATVHFEILKFVQKDMDDLYITRLLPRLAPQQRKAIQLAYEQGYYTFPRKIGLEELASLAKVSKQTFREHLRRAETKLLPLLFSQ